jgi:hypothetical protein
MAPSYLAAATLLLVVALAPPLAAGDVLANFRGATGDIYYVANSSYHNNLQHLDATLPANASSSPALFAIAAVGASPDTIHALLHCRGDINAYACRTCATGAFEDAQQLCAYNKDVTVFYELCVLYYSN